jgi:hypothetical protein
MVPRAPTLATDGSVITRNTVAYHAYSIGAVRIIVSDLRSQALKREGRVMDNTQLDWLLRQFSRAKEYSVIVWASTRPWIALEDTSKDHWGAFPVQRRIIADFVASNKVTNLVAIRYVPVD